MSRIKYILETIISTLFYYTGFNWLYAEKMCNNRNIPIIFYHEIGNGKGGLTEFSVNVEPFEKQIQWLSRHFNIVSIDEIIKHIKGEIKLSGRVAAVTFDGGYAGNYKYAFPVLKRYNAPATIYITTEPIDDNIPWERKLLYLMSLTKKDRFTIIFDGKEHNFEIKNSTQLSIVKNKIQNHMFSLTPAARENRLKQLSHELGVDRSCFAEKLFLSWNQINEMNKDPLITIGSHTLTHRILTKISYADAKKEIFESKLYIEKMLGETITSFCYPDGHFSKRIIDLVKNAGYTSSLAVVTPEIKNDLNKIGDDVFQLRRLFMFNRAYNPLLAMELCGIRSRIKYSAKKVLSILNK